jgi:hypothetical protein
MRNRKQKLDPDLINEIRRILVEEWNPIGISHYQVIEHEYDNYLSRISTLVTSGKTYREISEYLYQLETLSMGLSGDKERCSRVAARLLDSYTAFIES